MELSTALPRGPCTNHAMKALEIFVKSYYDVLGCLHYVVIGWVLASLGNRNLPQKILET